MAKDPATVAAAPPVRHPYAKPDAGRETEQDEFPTHPLIPRDDLTMGNDKMGIEDAAPPVVPVEDLVDEDALAAAEQAAPMPIGYLGVEFGPTNEFTEKRIATLKQDLQDLIDAVGMIDAQLEHLNARRTDAMRACSGINADLARLGDTD